MANKKITDLMSGTPVRDSLLESAIDISGTMDSRKVKAGVVADLASANVAAPYDSTVTYAIGQYCLYEGDIYRCIAITTGAFDSTAWTHIVVTGEFRRVVELTSAQYTALSSAEKNNGTLYVITDEETTASDIPYSSGVSVADKLDSLSDINKGTRTFVGILGKPVNSYYRLGFNLPQAKSESITVNSVIKTGDPTEVKSLFTLANYASNGYFQLYGNSSSLVEGAYYEVNVTIS